MSTDVYMNIAQLRGWNEHELLYRDLVQNQLVELVKRELLSVNRAWTFHRVEAPILIPRSMISDAYSSDDIWETKTDISENNIVLRAETTPATYAMIKQLYPLTDSMQPPRCFWQVGKSFRRETQATAARLRFFEFTQLEFQCLYGLNTKADYRAAIMDTLKNEISWLCKSEARIIESDRLPDYSESTIDIEVRHNDNWREVASVSIRKDFEPFKNLEIAIGLDRIVDIATDNG